MIFRPCYFYFFSILGEWGGWVLESMENSILFFFEGFPNPKFGPNIYCGGLTYKVGTNIQNGGLTYKTGINLNEGTNNGT